MLILSYENEVSLTCKLYSFSYERMSTKTRFEEEAKGNSEIQLPIGHRKEVGKLTFRAFALRRSEWRNCGLCGLYTERWSCAIGWFPVT